MSTVPRAVVYARCSAQRQAEKELSIPAQLDACRAEAKRRGWEIVAEYVDEAESARTADRPQFQEMIAAARKKPRAFEHILVWKFSRFSRSREDSVLYKAMLARAGVKLISLNEPVDDSPAGRMLEGMLEVLDEFYSANLAEDTVRGMRKNASLGYWSGGRVPTGYRTKRTGSDASPKSVLEPDPDWAPVVQRMFQMVLQGQGSHAIATTLDREGLRTPLGKRWTVQTILHVLRNEVYTGVYSWGRVRTGRQAIKEADPIRIENAHEALVTREEFEAVQALLEKRRRQTTPPNRLRAGNHYLLSGLLWCAHCEAPFIGHPAKNGTVHYYGCQTKMKTGAEACPSRLLNQKMAESAVVRVLKDSVLTEENLTRLYAIANQEVSEASANVANERAALQAQITDLRRKLDRLYAALEDGSLELADLAPRIRDTKARLDALTASEKELAERGSAEVVHLARPEQIRRSVEALGRFLTEGSCEARRAFLRSWVQRIVADGYELTMRYSLPPLYDEGQLAMAAGGESMPLPEPETEGAEPGRLLNAPRVLPLTRNGSRCLTGFELGAPPRASPFGSSSPRWTP